MLVHLAQYLHPPIPRNNKTSHKETKTIYTFKRRRVEASHDVSDPPTHRQVFIHPELRRPWIQQYTMLHLGGGWKSTSVLCTSVLCTPVLAVRISSFSLECFNTCRSISSHWGNGSNCECLYRKLPLMNLLVHSGGSRSRRSLMNWGLEAYRCFKTIAPLFGITTTNGS